MSIQADIDAVARISAVPSILRVISEMTGLRLTLIARVTSDSWTACATLDRLGFGLDPGDQLDVATTLCSEVRDSHSPIVIEHASQEPEFCNHPTPKMYHFESYVAFPIFRSNGEYFGNLCGLDTEPLRLRDEKTVSMLRLFAELVSLQLTAEEDQERNRLALSEERRTGELRETFIAALGHDLRTPLASVIAGSDLLLYRNLEPDDRQVVEQIRASGKRIARLVDDLVDFARGRFGDGIPTHAEEIERVDEIARQVVAEVASIAPDRSISLRCDDAIGACVDRARMAQLMSNLVTNAVQHSPEGAPVDVRLEGSDDGIRFVVQNQGEPIPAEIAPQLFEPFYRGGDPNQHRSGLGLGLFIASQIARGHGGKIEFTSTREDGTTFVVTLPRTLIPTTSGN